MRILIILALTLVTCASLLRGQARPQIQHLGFSGGVVSARGVAAAAQISIAADLRVARTPIELSVGSSTGNLTPAAGTRHDVFVSAIRTWRASRHLIGGAGIGLHKLETTRINAGEDGVTMDDVLTGFRPALEGFIGVNLPLAPADGAGIRLTVRSAVMRGFTQLGLGVGVRISPARGRMMLGEVSPATVAASAVTRSWESVVAEVMLFEKRLSPLYEIVATSDLLVIKLASADRAAMRDAVIRVARVLNGCSEAVQLEIAAPESALLAAAATSAGFPAERIVTASTLHGSTLRAIRPAPATPRRPVR